MTYLKYILAIITLAIAQMISGQTKKNVSTFNKVIISPHIEAIFVENEEESVIIENSTEPEEKINIEVNKNVLRVYLDDAKETTKNKTIRKNGIKRKVPMYKGKVLTVTINYKQLKALSVRGEQKAVCTNKLTAETFSLKIYGESLVVLEDVDFQNLDADIYGENTLTIKKGTIQNQKITAYGESISDLLGVNNNTTRIKAFGEAEFKIQASNSIKFTAIGEAKLYFKGDASIDKGLNIGNVDISKIQ